GFGTERVSPRVSPGIRPSLVRRSRPMSHRDELTALLTMARRLSKLCRQGVAVVIEARDHHADPSVMDAASHMASELLKTEHAAEDELVAFVLDCSRCGRRVHWVPRRGMRARPLGPRRARAGRPPASFASGLIPTGPAPERGPGGARGSQVAMSMN